MHDRFHVRGDSAFRAQQARNPIPAVDLNGSARPWQLVGELQQLMGTEAEPDSLFFVDLWTVGRDKAIANLRKRQVEQADENRKAKTGVSTLAYIEQRNVGSDLVNLHPLAWEPEMHPAAKYAAAESRQDTEWEELVAECVSEEDALLPMTEERACRILHVVPGSTVAELKAAYRHKVSRWHPDRFQFRLESDRYLATRQMSAINEAYHLLRSGALRQSA